jgi:hypothetical protein
MHSPVFTFTNQLTGSTGCVYRHGPATFEVVLNDACGEWMGSVYYSSEGDAIRYVLDYV